MKITMERRHTVRPENYEAIHLVARIELDLDSETDAEYKDMEFEEIGDSLSEAIDLLLDTDVDRALRSDGQHIQDTHLWAFYEKG